MSLLAFIPILTTIGVILVSLNIIKNGSTSKRNIWMFPATLSALFLFHTLYCVVTEGLFGFWDNTIMDFWGNQIWIDLMFAFGMTFALLITRARAVGMQPIYWLLLLCCSGSIGLLAMYARVLYLEEKAA